jgi:hypothetical protein
MTGPDRAGLQRVATECVTLVARQFGRHLDWSLASLDELPCALSADEGGVGTGTSHRAESSTTIEPE